MANFTLCYDAVNGAGYDYKNVSATSKAELQQLGKQHCPDNMELTKIILQQFGSFHLWFKSQKKDDGWDLEVLDWAFPAETSPA